MTYQVSTASVEAAALCPTCTAATATRACTVPRCTFAGYAGADRLPLLPLPGCQYAIDAVNTGEPRLQCCAWAALRSACCAPR